MPKKRLPRIARRTWLNTEQGLTAYIRLSIERCEKSFYGDLEIKDCNRQVNINLDSKSKDKRAVLKKIKKIRDILNLAEKFIKEN